MRAVGLSPERFIPVEVDAVIGAEGNTEVPQKTWHQGSTGVEDRGTHAEISQEPGRSCALLVWKMEGRATPKTTTWPERVAPASPGAHVQRGHENRSANEVPPSEGNEARRKGEREVRAANSTDEGGELDHEDPVEGRGGRGGESNEGTMTETLSLENISTKLERITELARKHPEWAFSSLHHIIDVAWLREAMRRVHIPKGDGRTRPIGIPTLEDKILQRAVTMVLEAIYEQDFKPCSYGFRPGRSAHDALQALWDGLMAWGGGTILEADIADFFGTLDHAQLRVFLDRRVTDGVLRKVIHKWLKAGVMEGGMVTYPESGTPQGGVISPLLANIYLHEVLDEWFERDVRPRLQGRAQLVRYADDFTLVFEQDDDARRVMAVLPKRFGKYGLKPHPEKTRLVRFKRRPQLPGKVRGGTGREPAPDTFDFLGFTHLWGVSRKGRWYVQRKTATKRLTRALDRIRQWYRQHRHDDLADQHRVLASKLRGHYGYYGITRNSQGLSRFSHEVRRIWRKWLVRVI